MFIFSLHDYDACGGDPSDLCSFAIYPRKKFQYFSMTAKSVQFYHSYISHNTAGREGITELRQTIGHAYNSLFFYKYLSI
jgi:hypothetical protein